MAHIQECNLCRKVTCNANICTECVWVAGEIAIRQQLIPRAQIATELRDRREAAAKKEAERISHDAKYCPSCGKKR